MTPPLFRSTRIFSSNHLKAEGSYTDLSAVKKRPVVIISKDSINLDAFVVAKITSVISGAPLAFRVNLQELVLPLPKPGEVRTDQIFTAHKSLIIKKISRFEAVAIRRLNALVQSNFEVP